jgi:triosephosphate isomerase
MPLDRPIVLGNWKMNGLERSGRELARGLLERLDRAGDGGRRGTIGVCPPATLLIPLRDLLAGSRLLLGGQDCHSEEKGAFTGDISAEMLADAGCRLVLAGHSERRHGHGETDERVRAKAAAALRAGLTPVVCVGETEEEYLAGRTLERLDAQIAGSLPDGVSADRLVIAYEPVWAIGTGRTPGDDEIAATHGHVRRRLAERVGGDVPVLYGGSVKASNAGEIMAQPGVDGALVGGASLAADEFFAIYSAAVAAEGLTRHARAARAAARGFRGGTG